MRLGYSIGIPFGAGNAEPPPPPDPFSDLFQRAGAGKVGITTAADPPSSFVSPLGANWGIGAAELQVDATIDKLVADATERSGSLPLGGYGAEGQWTVTEDIPLTATLDQFWSLRILELSTGNGVEFMRSNGGGGGQNFFVKEFQDIFGAPTETTLVAESTATVADTPICAFTATKVAVQLASGLFQANLPNIVLSNVNIMLVTEQDLDAGDDFRIDSMVSTFAQSIIV